MSSSSQPQTSLDDLLKDLTIDLSDVGTSTASAVNITEYSYTYDANTMSTITLSPSVYSVTGAVGAGSYSTNTINTVSIDSNAFTWNLPEEWVGCFPDWDRVKDMCEKYPAMEIALRNFQTVYQLVKDDYDNPTPKK